MTDEPTDEALENLFVEETGFDIDDFPAAIFDFARAVLEKWGQPAQAGEPVAREPLTPERVKEIVRGAGYDQCGIPDTERAAFINGLRHGEREHGIKGGQHGTE